MSDLTVWQLPDDLTQLERANISNDLRRFGGREIVLLELEGVPVGRRTHFDFYSDSPVYVLVEEA